jgi:hypothetical protein
MKVLDARLQFTLVWTFATFSAFLVSLLFIEIGETPDVGILQAAIGSFLIAFAQTFVLKYRIFPGWWMLSIPTAWVVMTIIGIGAIGWVVPSTNVFLFRISKGLIQGILGGIAIGFAQWLAIRKQYPSSHQWIQINCVAWAVAMPIGSLIGMFLHEITQVFFAEILGLAVTWLLVSFFTGFHAYRLLDKH